MSGLGQEIHCAHLPWQLEMSQKQRDFKNHLVPAPLACSIHVSGLAVQDEVFLCTVGQNCFKSCILGAVPGSESHSF